jgi:ATP-dependent metalloprotease
MHVSEKDKLMTAYHEGGHTLANLLTEGTLPLHKVTILPRGPALGFTAMLPDKDYHSQTRKEIIAGIDVALGGRIAEELIYGNDKITTGCSSDMNKATDLAYAYVRTFGMNADVNLISASKDDLSDQFNFMIDEEVQRILKGSLDRTRKLILGNKWMLDKLAKELVVKETMSAKEVRDLLGLKKKKMA